MRLITLVSPGVGLRQGDVLSVTTETQFSYGSRLGVVITADCDLAQAKHYGQVLMCPIVPAASYYQDIWCAKRLENFRERTLRRLRSELDNISKAGLLKSALSDHAFEIVCSNEAALRTALMTLELAPGKVEELASLAASLEKTCLPAESLAALVAASAYAQRKEVSAIRAKLFTEFKVELAKDAIDIVVVHDDITGDDVIHVILLRAPFSIPHRHISMSGSKNEDFQYRRIGRFAPEIKFLIAQKFGTLFSRVGMKSEIEQDRDAAIELLKDSK